MEDRMVAQKQVVQDEAELVNVTGGDIVEPAGESQYFCKTCKSSFLYTTISLHQGHEYYDVPG